MGKRHWRKNIFLLDAHENDAQQNEPNLKQLESHFQVRLRDEDFQEYNM